MTVHTQLTSSISTFSRADGTEAFVFNSKKTSFVPAKIELHAKDAQVRYLPSVQLFSCVQRHVIIAVAPNSAEKVEVENVAEECAQLQGVEICRCNFSDGMTEATFEVGKVRCI